MSHAASFSPLGTRIGPLLLCYPFSPFRSDHPGLRTPGVEKGEVHKLGKHPSHDNHLLKRKIADNILGISENIEAHLLQVERLCYGGLVLTDPS